MRRRGYLAAVAGAASLLAGCSGRSGSAADATETVTPVPVPSGPSGRPTAAGTVSPPAVGDAHVAALDGESATVAVQYELFVDGRMDRRIRLLSTGDGDAITHRRYIERPVADGGVSRGFSAMWHDGEEAVLGLVDEARVVYRVREDVAPVPAERRFDRERLVGVLAGFVPAATERDDGYDLVAEEVPAPRRLPPERTVGGTTEGRLSGRLTDAGVVADLAAEFTASTGGERGRMTYRLVVTDRGTTTVERPDAAETFDWYERLRAASPVPEAG